MPSIGYATKFFPGSWVMIATPITSENSGEIKMMVPNQPFFFVAMIKEWFWELFDLPG